MQMNALRRIGSDDEAESSEEDQLGDGEEEHRLHAETDFLPYALKDVLFRCYQRAGYKPPVMCGGVGPVRRSEIDGASLPHLRRTARKNREDLDEFKRETIQLLASMENRFEERAAVTGQRQRRLDWRAVKLVSIVTYLTSEQKYTEELIARRAGERRLN